MNMTTNLSVCPDSAQTSIVDYVDTRPLFINATEQIFFTLYAVLSFISISVLSTIFITLVAYHEEFHTPYFVILVINTVYENIISVVVYVSIIYISLSGSSPYSCQRWKCVIYKVLSFSPFLAYTHSLCLLSVERVLFFYRPLWYFRSITNSRIVIIECILFSFAIGFNMLSIESSQIYFSNISLICIYTTTTWGRISQFVFYYFLSTLFVMAAITALYLLIWKQKKAIKSQNQTIGEVQSQSDGDRLGQADGTTPAAANGNYKSNIIGVKTALKIIASISGVYWLTLFPSLLAFSTVFAQFNSNYIEKTTAVSYRILVRFFVFLPFLSWILNLLIYLYINKGLRKKLIQTVRRVSLRNTVNAAD